MIARMKWARFSHAVLNGEKTERPFFAAHLVDDRGRAPVTACGDATATPIPTGDEPHGFMLACCTCLAFSEVMTDV